MHFSWNDLPTTEEQVTRWIFWLTVGYLAFDIIAACVAYAAGRPRFSLVTSVANSVLFSTSFLLLFGALNKPTLDALGSLTTYLLFAGLIGVVFPIQESLSRLGAPLES